MSRRFDCDDPDERRRGLDQAAQAARRGDLVVLPTDTVYGLGTDAFAGHGVAALLMAKGRGRDMPVPVLVGSARAMSGLTSGLPSAAHDLVEAFWPGGLTVVVPQAPSLQWDLGDANGTVALRMPLHPVAIELLAMVGPMAVSSANRSGEAPATTVDEAELQLGRLGGRLPRRRPDRHVGSVEHRRPHRRRANAAAGRRGQPRRAAHCRTRPGCGRVSEPNAGASALHVLHVCTGNICRSPMAERIMRAELAARFGPVTDVVVHSAGTYGGHAGGPMNPAAANELAARGLDADGFTSTWLREPQVEWAELLLTASAEHRSQVLQLEPRALRRTFTLLELARLAGHVRPEDLAPGSPGERLRALAAAAAELRGLHPPDGRTGDDIDDPYGESPEVFTATADQIRDAIAAILVPVTAG